MQLKNNEDDRVYRISTEECEGGIRIFAEPVDGKPGKFVMRYMTLAAFRDDWEDAN